MFNGLSATDGDLSIEKRDIKMCLHVEATSEWKISKPEKITRKKGHISQDFNSYCF